MRPSLFVLFKFVKKAQSFLRAEQLVPQSQNFLVFFSPSKKLRVEQYLKNEIVYIGNLFVKEFILSLIH